MSTEWQPSTHQHQHHQLTILQKSPPKHQNRRHSHHGSNNDRIVLLLDLDCFYAQCERVRLGLPLQTSLALLQWNSVLAVTYPAREFGIRRGDSWEAVRDKSNGHCVALHLPILKASTNTTSTSTAMKNIHGNTTTIIPQNPYKNKKSGTSNDHPEGKEKGKEFSQEHGNHTTDDANDTHDDENDVSASIEQAYEQKYCLNENQRQQILCTEAGKQRFPYEGKACLERYRIASSRIFSVVLEALTTCVGGKDKFILERASIDELFIDVTDFCWDDCDQVQQQDDEHSSIEKMLDNTVVVGDNDLQKQINQKTYWNREDNSGVLEVQKALLKGCMVAKQVRNAVYEKLGFTLSAGISTCKLVAKLGASYGKPNGQAVIFPHCIDLVMEETKILKVRHLGGKIGKKVQALLPPEEETMGSIARLLSLPRLTQELGAETGRLVFDACRGIDSEPVRETAGALVKSITAYKSFFKTQLDSQEITKWVTLLTSDVLSRVEQDSTRNSRFPKSLTIHYHCSKHNEDDSKPARIIRSVRIPFPKRKEVTIICSTNADDQQRRMQQLVERVRCAVKNKEGAVNMHRIGLCATDFETILRDGGITSFFAKGNSTNTTNTASSSLSSPDQTKKTVIIADTQSVENDTKLNFPKKEEVGSGLQNGDQAALTPPSADEEFARKLQRQYDRENQVLTAVEKRTGGSESRKGPLGFANKTVKATKKARIDNFFRQKPK